MANNKTSKGNRSVCVPLSVISCPSVITLMLLRNNKHVHSSSGRLLKNGQTTSLFVALAILHVHYMPFYFATFCWFLIYMVHNILFISKKAKKKLKIRLMHLYCICKKQVICDCRFLTARPAYVE